MTKNIKNLLAIIITSMTMLFVCTNVFATAATPKQAASKQATPKPANDKQTEAQIDAFIDNFVQYMVDKHDFDEDYLYDLFDQVTVNKIVIKRMNHPFEAKPWYKYRAFFLTDTRIKKGAAYWQQHKTTLQKAEKKYGVPASIIVAILGVETDYGARKGKFSTLESLTTLAFNYPSRGSFFKKELEHFLLLTREQELDPLKITGSHAGAIGLPQFMPSSYRHYAVDFSGKHHIDLVNSDEDAIGSIANYLKRNGWRRNRSIAEKVNATGSKFQSILPTSMIPRKPSLSEKELKKHGVTPQKNNRLQGQALFFDLKGKNANEYWVGYYNFYVISRYNRNKHYAMAVYQLSDEITQQRKLALARKHHGKSKT